MKAFIAVLMLALFVSFPDYAFPATVASYYTRESCAREGTSGIMANGRRLNDEAFTCASWDYTFGSRLRIRNVDTGREVVVSVTDRGPNKKLYRSGVTVDLTRVAYGRIADLKTGHCRVEVTLLSGRKIVPAFDRRKRGDSSR